MAQTPPTRSIVGMIFRNFINSLKPRRWRGELRGVDYNGTKYFEIPLDSSTNRRRPARWFEPATGGDENFDQQLPAEWESWLRNRRREPPTEEEVLKNLEIMKMKKKNALIVEAKAGKPTPMEKGMETFPKRPEYELGAGKPPSE